MSDPSAALIGDLLDRVLTVPGDRAAPVAVTWLRHALNAERVELRLLDRRRERLHLLAAEPPPGEPPPPHLPLRGSTAGHALLTDVVLEHRADDQRILHIPVSAYGNTSGTLIIARPEPTGGAGSWSSTGWRRLGRALAVLLHQAASTTDGLEVARRSYDYSIAAELQWQLLPPADVATADFALRAQVEPAPRVSSDLFDWSLNGAVLTIALLDALGRGLPATQSGDLALAALRNARRRGGDLAEQTALADQALWDRYHGHAAVHALLVEIDLEGHGARAVHAGSPHAIRRRGHAVTALDLAAHDPLGLLDRTPYRPHPIDLVPGDTLLLLSDGTTNAADPRGRSYGLEGIAEALRASAIPIELPAQLIGDLRTHTGGDLAEDATAIALDWHTPEQRSTADPA